MKYWLRRVIFEDMWERQTKELVALCKRAEIDGVLLMEQSHMMLMSPYPLEKHRRMAVIYQKIGERLRSNGIRYGVNIASLVGHTDMNVPQEYRLNCGRFVGDDLRKANACYCILDEKWQKYAAKVCRLYAATNPEYLFLDDDFRSLNHGRTLGCFCPIHVKRTEELLKQMNLQGPAAEELLAHELTAQDILDALQEGGERALAIRSAWMEANAGGQKQAARRIGEAVHRDFPEVMLGLMSSDEMRHSLQGRKIEEVLRELAGTKHKMLYRPTGAIYGDALHKAVFEGHQRMVLTMGEVKGELHTVSELELFPHSRFGCSRRFSELMMKTQILAGADDMTLNLYDYLGNPVEREPVWERMMKENKSFLQKLSQLRKGKKLKGFGLPYRMEESRFRTWNRRDVAKLYANRTLDVLLPSMGIPVQFTEGSGNALIGEAIFCYSDEELLRFLSNGFLTDARGAQILWQRGFGQYLGCRVSCAGDDIPALEQLLPTPYAGEFAGDFLPCRWNLFESAERFILEPFAEAQVLTKLFDLEKDFLGAGTVLYENTLGGRCAVLAAEPKPETWNFRARAYLVGRIIAQLCEGELPFLIQDCPNLGPIYYEDEETGEGILAVINGSLDAYKYRFTEKKISLTERIDGAEDQEILEGMSMAFWRTERTRESR